MEFKFNHQRPDSHVLAALLEQDPSKLVALIQQSLRQMQDRFLELGTRPGTVAEMRFIRGRISSLIGLIARWEEIHGFSDDLKPNSDSCRSESGARSAISHLKSSKQRMKRH